MELKLEYDSTTLSKQMFYKRYMQNLLQEAKHVPLFSLRNRHIFQQFCTMT